MIRLVAFSEHQTTAEPTLSLRFLGDTVRTWENQSITHSNNSLLPDILPLVLAQKAEVWHLSTKFRTLFAISPRFLFSPRQARQSAIRGDLRHARWHHDSPQNIGLALSVLLLVLTPTLFISSVHTAEPCSTHRVKLIWRFSQPLLLPHLHFSILLASSPTP
jgi:Putative transposase, YhgA-like